MRVFTPLALTTALALVAPVSSYAAQHSDLTQEQRQKLETLSPDIRQDVIDRLGPEQTIDGVLETMILNSVSAKHPGAQRYVPNITESNVEVVFEDERWLVNIDPLTLAVRNARKIDSQ